MDVFDDPFLDEFDEPQLDKGEDYFQYLLMRLQGPLKTWQRHAVSALGFTNDPRAFAILVPLLDSPDASVRQNALQAIHQLDAPHALPFLLDALSHPDINMRLVAANELSASRVSTAFVPLEGWLNDSNPDVRCAALSALSLIDPVRSLPHLLTALSDPTPIVRLAATQCFIGKEDVAGNAHPPIIAALLHLLNDEDADVRANAAGALGMIGDRTVLHPLAWVAEHDLSYTRLGHAIQQYAVDAIKHIYHRQAPSSPFDGTEL